MLKGCGGEIQKGMFCIDFPLSYICIWLVRDVATLSLMLLLEVKGICCAGIFIKTLF